MNPKLECFGSVSHWENSLEHLFLLEVVSHYLGVFGSREHVSCAGFEDDCVPIESNSEAILNASQYKLSKALVWVVRRALAILLDAVGW